MQYCPVAKKSLPKSYITARSYSDAVMMYQGSGSIELIEGNDVTFQHDELDNISASLEDMTITLTIKDKDPIVIELSNVHQYRVTYPEPVKRGKRNG